MQGSVAPNLGRETTIQALGQSWTIGKWTVRIWDALLEWVKPRLPDPFAGLDQIIDKVHERVAEKLIAEAQAKSQALLSMASPAVQALLDGTPEGRVQVLYQLLRQHHPDITLE